MRLAIADIKKLLTILVRALDISRDPDISSTRYPGRWGGK
jgi:hypothetical protein